MLRGMQSGYTKNMCFLCNWDTRYKGKQYQMRDWILRIGENVGSKNVIREALVPKEKILLPPLHVKLGIVKSFIKQVAKRVEIFECLRKIFPRLSPAKLANGVLNGPDIRKLMNDESFDAVLIETELVAWHAIQMVIEGFLGKKRSENYKSDVQTMLDAFEKHQVNMSLKIHFMHFHLNEFSTQLATESDEHGERYHQVSLPFEKRYKGKKAPDAVLAEICWWSKAVFEGAELDSDSDSEMF